MSELVLEIQFSSSSHLGTFENTTIGLTLDRKRLVSSLSNPVEIKLLYKVFHFYEERCF